jgi:hypothetical protein
MEFGESARMIHEEVLAMAQRQDLFGTWSKIAHLLRFRRLND